MYAFKCIDTSAKVMVGTWNLLSFALHFLPSGYFLGAVSSSSDSCLCNVALCRLLGNYVALKDRSAFQISVLYTT